MKSLLSFVLQSLALAATSLVALAGSADINGTPPITGKIPIIYSTDLFLPPDDIDDHFDLAALACLSEFDCRAFVFDVSSKKPSRLKNKPKVPGLASLEQICVATGMPLPPHAEGLREPLASLTDKGDQQPESGQRAVNLILTTLRDSPVPITLFLTGSCRDYAAAFNRDSDLFRAKVKALYVVAGAGTVVDQKEWNVALDPFAYHILMASGLPLYWSPCIPDRWRPCTPEEARDGTAFSTCFRIYDQTELTEVCGDAMNNYFAYFMPYSEQERDPIAFVRGPRQKIQYHGGRDLYSVGPLFHAAGRKIYRIGENSYAAYTPDEAQKRGCASHEVEVFRYENLRLKSVKMAQEFNPNVLTDYVKIESEPGDETSTTKVFRYTHPEFALIMKSVVRNLYREQALQGKSP